MQHSRVRLLALLTIIFCTSTLAAATGRISGQLRRGDGSPLGGAVVSLAELSAAAVTDSSGRYLLDGVPEGSYSVIFTTGQQSTTETNVAVRGGETTVLNKDVDWQITVAESLTVTAASRRAERIVEAPAAVSVASEEEIELAAPTGQLPRVIESAPGVDFTQSGLYDFNFNARGFNSSLNRRILTLIDGRDPSVPFLGAQEWAALSYPVDEMRSVELVRGPGSALYGPNAFNGVLNMITKSPRDSEGGKVQLTAGDLATGRIDLRHAGGLGSNWFYRVTGGYQQGDDFTRSRTTTLEYSVFCTAPGQANCLPREAVGLQEDEAKIAFGGLRLDRHFANTATLTLEGGYADLGGPTFLTGIGRVHTTDVQRPWARVNFNLPHWNASAYYDARKAEDQIALSSGARLFEDSNNTHGELQTNWAFFDNRVRAIGGIAYHEQSIDTADSTGRQTLMAESHSENQQSVFGQFEADILKNLELVVAARYDESTLHEPQVSPKAALVYSITPNHALRLNYSEAFQVPNYSEFFLRAPAGAPVTALAPIETAFRPALGGVTLGFQSIPVLALGNGDLQVEEITSKEIGYSGIFAGKAFVTLDYYQNDVENFVTDLLPGVNPAYPQYVVPAGVAAPVAAQILATLQRSLPPANYRALTNFGAGPAFVFSYTNAGTVETQGAEFAINYYLTNNLSLDFNYSWFDFEVLDQLAGDVLLPNAPEHKYNAGVSVRGQKFDGALKYRWVDDFDWAAGVFKGPVPSYGVVNASGAFHFTDRISFGANVTNLLDDEHYESFGGDILRRRALGFVTFGW